MAQSAPATTLHDGLGSAMALVDSTGTVQNRYAYDPWGNAIASGTSGSVPNPFRYRGAMLDSVTGLYYTGTGFYDPRTARRTSPCKDTKYNEDACGEDEADFSPLGSSGTGILHPECTKASLPKIPGRIDDYTDHAVNQICARGTRPQDGGITNSAIIYTVEHGDIAFTGPGIPGINPYALRYTLTSSRGTIVYDIEWDGTRKVVTAYAKGHGNRRYPKHP